MTLKHLIEVTDKNVPIAAKEMGLNEGSLWSALADAKDVGDRLYVAIPVKDDPYWFTKF